MIGLDKVEGIDETQELKASGLSDDRDPAFQWHSSGDRSKPAIHYGDAVTSFDEISAAKGSLGRFPGNQLLPLIQQLIRHA